jgi:hypothetical protein
MDLGLFLAILNGLAWTIVYIDGLRIGIKTKAMPCPSGYWD